MKNFQFNIRLNKQSNVAYLNNLWEEYSLFPMFWIEEFADLDDKYKVKLDHMLATPLVTIFAAQWILVRSNDFTQSNGGFIIFIYCFKIIDNQMLLVFI